MKQEKRSLTIPPQTAGRKIFGHAALYNVRSENLGTQERPIFEIIEKGAFDKVLNDDCRALFNHSANHILARSKNGKGTLRLSLDAKGLRYEFEAPDTQVGNDLLVSIKRGDVDQSSFGFSVAKDGEKWTQEGGASIRRISRIERLYDVSPCVSPGYASTTVSARSKANTPAESHSVLHKRRSLNLSTPAHREVADWMAKVGM